MNLLIFQERPERQIYRPGMGRFSSQTITKNDDDETDSTKTEDTSKAQEDDELGGISLQIFSDFFPNLNQNLFPFQQQQHHLPAKNTVKLKAGKIPNTLRNRKKEPQPLKRKIPPKFIQQENSEDLTADKNVLLHLIKLTQMLLLSRKLLIKNPRDPEKVMRVNVKKGNSKRKRPQRLIIVRTAFWIYLLNNELSK